MGGQATQRSPKMNYADRLKKYVHNGLVSHCPGKTEVEKDGNAG